MTKSNETDKAATRKIDWERIEPEWRAGIKSVMQIAFDYEQATTHKISHTAINKHFRKLNVPRDLAAKVRAKAEAIVSASMVSGPVSTETKPSDARIIDDSAKAVAAIRLTHRTDIQRMRKMVVGFITALEDDDLVKDEKKKLTLQMRVQIMQKVVETHKTVVSMEREHFGITSRFGDDEDTPLQQYDTVETARRVAFLLASALNKGA